MSAISIDNLTWTYAGSKRPALDHISLEIKKGEAVLITGPAAAGKTTLCYCLNGLIPNFFPGFLDGSIKIDGHDPRYEEISDLSRIVGMVLQDYTGQLLQPTVIDDVAFALENFGVPPDEIERRVREAITTVGLTGFEERNPHTLSGGEQQLCAIASVIALAPEIYVLDEPISSLDPIGGELVSGLLKRILAKRENTFLIVEQRIEDFLPWVDRLVVMDRGRLIVEGPPFDLLNDPEKWEAMKAAGVNLPQIPALMNELRKRGIFDERLWALDPTDLPPQALRVIAERVRNPPRVSGNPVSTNIKMEDGAIIRVENLTHVYEGGVLALRDASLTVHPGELLAIIGQNGSGKTTLLKHLNGLLKPTRGRVFVKGLDASKADPGILSRFVGLVFQHPDRQLFKLSVRDELELGMRRLGLSKAERAERVRHILRLVNLEHAVDGTTFNLSLGERKRLALAAALSTDPDILLVDEPTTGQDLARRIEIMDLLVKLNGAGKTIMVVTHDMEIVAKYSRRVVVMSEGQIIADGPTASILRDEHTLAKAHLRAPPIVRLSKMLSETTNIPHEVLTLEEMVSMFG
jgi:energy-coupling factor transporter ATP-binding protein EcfA2